MKKDITQGKKKKSKNFNEVEDIPKGMYKGTSLNNEKREQLLSMADDPKVPMKYRKIIQLVAKGYSLKDSAKLMGYSPKYGSKIANNLVKYSLKNEKLVKKAYKVIEDMASNKPKLKKIKSDGTKVYAYPTHGHQLKAAEMVYERYEPTIKNPLIQLNQQLSPIDLSKYKLVPKDDEEGVVVVDVEQG